MSKKNPAISLHIIELGSVKNLHQLNYLMGLFYFERSYIINISDALIFNIL